MDSPPEEDGVIWPYFRGIPPEHEDVLSTINRGDFSIINDYNSGTHNLSDKWANYEQAKEVGIPIPTSFKIEDSSELENLELDFPIVVKGYPSGRGEDVHLCQTLEEAQVAYKSCESKGLEVVAQEYIEESHGRDLRVLVVDGEIACVLGRRGAEGEFLSNVSNGGAYFDYELKGKEKEAVEQAIRQFPVDVAGFDFLYSERGLLFCEINLAPGWTGKATAMLSLLVKLIKSRISGAADVDRKL
jgi:ribosomal protein S6--L-glutamate ligase